MKFSIVIPTYQHLDDCLRPCLGSIIKHHSDFSDIEVIVVANGSGQDTREYVESLGPAFKLVWFDEPIGYTRATNEGIKVAQGDYIVLLNNDCVILGSEWLNLLYQPFTEDELTGISGPLMLHCPDADRDFLVFFCVMVSRETLDSTGLLDEIFSPGYGEDCDLCARAVDLGWRLKQVPGETAKLVDKGCEDLPQWKRDKMWTAPFPLYHDGNKTFGADPERFERILERNKKVLKERYQVNTPSGLCKCGETMVDGVCVKCDPLNLWRASVIDGWFGLDEGRWLAQQVSQLPAGAKVLEVGSWHGRSSRFIADNLPAGGQVWCVDTWNGSSGEPEMHGSAHWDRGDHAFQWWWCNLHEHIMAGRVVPVRMDSANAAHTLGHLGLSFDLIFIDGDHSETGIKTDVDAWLPRLKPGGLICGHDYYRESEGPHWVHVRQYVEEKFPGVEKAATSLWYTRPQARRVVYDCFPFNDELDLLELRFNELDSVVDRWVIVEAEKSHSGRDKPLHFRDNMGRFQPWLHKVTHIVVDQIPTGLDGPELHWSIERRQRDSIMRALTECHDDDIVLIGDTDEIPRAEAVASYQPSMGLCCLEMKLYYGSMNCEGVEPWRWSRLVPYGMLKTMSPCQVRYTPNYEPHQVIANGGWHFSFMGGPDEWISKLENTPHQEYNKPEFKDRQVMLQRVRSGQDLLGRPIPYRLVDVDDTFPAFVVANRQRFIDNQFILEEALPMHPESYQFVEMVKADYPDYFTGKKVLEVGSLDINGSVRQFFDDCDYMGIDLGPGKGVDMVAKAAELDAADTYDVVISSEMLEHDSDWNASLKRMYANLKPGGLLVISCAGPTRPEHGTKRTDTYSSPFTTDYYRNLSKEDLLNVLPNTLFSECTVGYARGEKDLHFWGIKVPAKVDYLADWLNRPRERQPVGHGLGTVTACISTKDRYFTTLPLAITAVAQQTHKVSKLVLYDDGEQLDLRQIAPYDNLLKMLDELKIEWAIQRTPRLGQVANHQHCLDSAETEWIWRVDDDEVPMPTCLEHLLIAARDYQRGGLEHTIGAVAGLVHHPGNVQTLPGFIDGSLNDVSAGLNIQWYNWNSGPREVEHLYSTFIYRVDAGRKVGGYPKGLSVIGHREETIFTHELKRAGYHLLVTPDAKTFHLREAKGGIRSFTDGDLWAHDERVFQERLADWGAEVKPTKLIVLDCGIGDHFAFKSILPQVKEMHADKELVLAVCYPDVFYSDNLKLISIAEAQQMLGDKYGESSIYKQLWDRQWKGPIAEGMLEVCR